MHFLRSSQLLKTMKRRHVCIAGKNQISVDALLYLINNGWGSHLLACPNASDDGRSGWQPSLARFAREFGIPIVTLDQAKEVEDLVFISLEYDKIIILQTFVRLAYIIFIFEIARLQGNVYICNANTSRLFG